MPDVVNEALEVRTPAGLTVTGEDSTWDVKGDVTGQWGGTIHTTGSAAHSSRALDYDLNLTWTDVEAEGVVLEGKTDWTMTMELIDGGIDGPLRGDAGGVDFDWALSGVLDAFGSATGEAKIDMQLHTEISDFSSQRHFYAGTINEWDIPL